MSFTANLTDFTNRLAVEFKAIRALIGTLGSLTTTNKANLVAAINEINAKPSGTGGAAINDTTPSSTTTYSGTKIESRVSAAVAGLVNSAPAALDTLAEFATALGNDASFASTTATALGNRVRVDAAQSLTATQQTQARSNIGAASTAAATATAVGLVELATNAEVNAGTDTARAVTPAGLRDMVGDPTTNFVATFEAGLL